MKCGNNKSSSCTVTISVLLILFVALLSYVLFIRIKEYYQQLDPMLYKIKETLLPLHPKVSEISFFEGDKSYTINKKRIYLCLKQQDDYYDFNMLIYVAIHELSHVLCDEIGHTPKFFSIFHNLLMKANDIGIYDPSIPIVKNYCGHD